MQAPLPGAERNVPILFPVHLAQSNPGSPGLPLPIFRGA
jgi:hypothetical protein